MSARRRKGYTHTLTAGHHTLIADEPEHNGGSDEGPTPGQLLALSLASCTAITIEMYAERKGWDLGELEVEVDHGPRPREGPARFDVTLKLPPELGNYEAQALLAIASRCPVHRTLKGEVQITDRIERVGS